MPSEKTLKRIVIFLGVVLVVGFLTLVSIIIYRAVNLGEDEDIGEAETGRIDLFLNQSHGLRLIKQSQDENFIVLVLEDNVGNQSLLIFETPTGEIIGYFPLEEVDENIEEAIEGN